METIDHKYKKLKSFIGKMEALVVAYSGGVDSALVLKVATEVLGEKAIGVTADSPSVPRFEIEESKSIAQSIGARHELVSTNEIENDNYSQNSVNRCYYCKFELYSHLIEVAKKEGIKFVANGTNLDDLGDYRPGLEAAKEFQVVSPLKEAGLNKAEVRELAKKIGLKIWDKPASPCLASRIPYGNAVTTEKLAMVEKAEVFLKAYGLKEIRVRHFGGTARIETPKTDLPLIEKYFEEISNYFHNLGFENTEWKQFKSGVLNALIENLKE
ncbi:MAG: ATP-dependent sacrificial sulfur transferase LarE [Flammeovirgaceae bacterium]|nr:ATP-dependent sacrificial sulfur transferase LarE [Flammeovirgaceae bacterium]